MSGAGTDGAPLGLVIVMSGYPPHHTDGYEVHGRAVARELARRGHRVTVLTSRAGGRGISEDHGVRVVRALAVGDDTARFGRMRARASCRALRRELARVRADVVVYWKQNGLCDALLAVRPAGGGAACDISSDWLLDVARTGGNWFRHFESASPSPVARLVKRLTSALTALALGVPVRPPRLPPGAAWFTDRDVWKRYLAAGFRVQTAPVITLGIELRRFRFVRERPDDGTFRVLFYGGVRDGSGLRTAVLALSDVPRPAVLSVVGAVEDKEYVAETAEIARASEVLDRVQFARPVPATELPGLLAAFHVLVVPSEAGRRFPRLILEAFAAGTPVVATPVGGAAEVLLEDQTALTFDPGNAHALARQLIRLMEDPELGERLALKARHLVEKRYATGYTVDQIEPILRTAATTA